MAGSVLGATAGLTSAGLLSASAYFVRRVITPEPERPYDALITAVDLDAAEPSVTLRADAASSMPGRYGLVFDDERGHARLGDVLGGTSDTVTRALIGVDRGTLAPGPARWDGWFYASGPRESLGLPTEDVTIDTELGPLPAWVVPGDDPRRWAILVHGRGATRQECVRGVRPLHEIGMTVLVPSYRNDPESPASPDGRYGLGLREWADVETAMRYALEHGATELVLMGWSMGGATVLQALDRSPLSQYVSRVVLDGPVVSWPDVIRHHAELHRLPAPVGAVGRAMLRHRGAARLAGLNEPLDLPLTDWVARADELTHPMLVIHSRADDFVPSPPSEELARARPDLVRFVPWEDADHCREWNTHPGRWEQLVRDFCAGSGS